MLLNEINELKQNRKEKVSNYIRVGSLFINSIWVIFSVIVMGLFFKIVDSKLISINLLLFKNVIELFIEISGILVMFFGLYIVIDPTLDAKLLTTEKILKDIKYNWLASEN
ncbi:hypothetical protein OZY43_02540 [Lactobacillus sp. ESL0785]|uniref:hypothetical protein n=1 Tax=Lactobacillus sp. ESL0785 TaxID=2983232 RepID=UPI0023F815E5|nr:hypothetical protein [Lactobacillus sp. ESL0785]WEV71300.1 hypothetical protein OZY43_02540 [Lactobacillus sp. ESL0785]